MSKVKSMDKSVLNLQAAAEYLGVSKDFVRSKIKESGEELVDLNFCAKFLSVSKDFVRKRIDNKEIASYKVGDLVRVRVDVLYAYRDKCERK